MDLTASRPRGPVDFLTLADRGPYAVGLITIEVTDCDNPARVLPTDVWYPADPSLRGQDLDPSRWPDHPLARPHEALASAPPAAGGFPLLAFSHGNSGLRRQSTFLTTHLASWGFVVAAPDHAGNTFSEMQGLDEARRKTVHLEARRKRPGDLRRVLDTVIDGGDGLPLVDAERVGTLGHSFGGWTAIKAPRIDPRVSAVCGMAPAAEPFIGRKAFEEGELPFSRTVSALLIAGIDDVLVDVDRSVRSIYDRLGEPRAFIGIEGADHFHFCDGIELLHMMHAMTPRQGTTRPLRPYADLLDEARMHRLLRAVVTCFFANALGDNRAATVAPAAEDLRRLDPALRSMG